MSDSTTRFSNRVEQYVKYRPNYPQVIVPYLRTEAHLQPDSVVADIGSGTGISTLLFLRNGNKVYGVEPNDDMRAKAEELLRGYDHFISLNGTAEETGLPAGSVDLVVAGQAFHWFNAARTKEEFRRIARQGAHCVLIWNERLTGPGFAESYEQLLKKHATDYAQVDHRNVTEEKIQSFFAPYPFTKKIFPNEQVFDFEGLKGRLLSSSYVPLETDPSFATMLTELGRIFANYAEAGKVRFEYETKVYCGLIKE